MTTSSRWTEVVSKCLPRWETPFYVFDICSLHEAIADLPKVSGTRPVKHFYSFKTTPVAPMVGAWIETGHNVEVVSEYEYLAARRLGCPPERILVNGPRKADWLRVVQRGSWIHIDSEEEACYVASLQNRPDYGGIGLRVAVTEMRDPDDSRYAGQFGLDWQAVSTTLAVLNKAGINPGSIHFHLQSNVPDTKRYLRTVDEIIFNCQKLGWYPPILDIGGGRPAPGENPREGQKYLWEMQELMSGLGDRLQQAANWISEVWIENGRSVTASCGALVLTVRDTKTQNGCRYLICDGGKVNQALVAEWDTHRVEIWPERNGALVQTTICGPTCMAWDWIARGLFADDIVPGDSVIWHDAGAYHLPFETAFSHPLARIIVIEDSGTPTLVRDRQTFEDWFARMGGGVYSHKCHHETDDGT